jgi:hypothetical protein
MLGKKPRRTLVLAVAVLIAAALTCFYLLSNPKPQTNFYRDRDGPLLADIRTSANIPQFPLTRLTNASISGNLWVWRAGQWQEENQHLKKVRCGREVGYRTIIKVPDGKWKIEMRSAPKRAFKLGDIVMSLPYRTNLVFSLEFPSRTEIEKEQNLSPAPEEPPEPVLLNAPAP